MEAVVSNSEEVIIPAELEEGFSILPEHLVTVRLNVHGACYYVAPQEEFEYYLTPCLRSLEDLLDWVRANGRKLAKNYERFVREND